MANWSAIGFRETSALYHLQVEICECERTKSSSPWNLLVDSGEVLLEVEARVILKDYVNCALVPPIDRQLDVADHILGKRTG